MTLVIMNGTLQREAVTAISCAECAADVLRVIDVRGRVMLLDAELVPGGQYEIRERRVVRRNAIHMAREFRARSEIHGGGYDRHVCAPAAHWSD